ncbi:MAG: Mut7-C RNAse domain-containing protein, partial [Chlorobiaceae bacterium]|nr:Mut7-C RNAse domain-containing protein [Chlorobiaceae bacterium]
CFEALPVGPVAVGSCGLQPVPPEPARFVADIHLGKTVRRLRLLGFDTLWFTGQDDRELLDLMERDKRILLTRDRPLLMNSRVVYGCCIRSDLVIRQVRQVVWRYNLVASARPFSRCLACNGLLESCRKESVEARLLPKTRRYYDTFLCCPSCGKIYWEGSHLKRLQAFVTEVLGR